MQYMEETRKKEKACAAKNSVRQKRTAFIVMAVLLTAIMASFPVMAASGGSGNVSNMLIKLVSLMCSMFKYVGIALFVWAIIQFILATKRSDADSKADAIQTAVCGIALIGVATIVNSLGIKGVSGVTDSELS